VVRSAIKAEKAVPPAAIAVPIEDQQANQQRIELTAGGLHAGGQPQHQLTSNAEQQGDRQGADHDEGCAPKPAGRDAIGAMAEPSAGEPHQLLTTHGKGRQHRRQLNVLN
jgi:hypothetical protein